MCPRDHQGLLREYHSIWSGASGLSYYCALVCVPDLIRLLAVWWHDKPKPKNNEEGGDVKSAGLGVFRTKHEVFSEKQNLINLDFVPEM